MGSRYLTGRDRPVVAVVLLSLPFRTMCGSRSCHPSDLACVHDPFCRTTLSPPASWVHLGTASYTTHPSCRGLKPRTAFSPANCPNHPNCPSRPSTNSMCTKTSRTNGAVNMLMCVAILRQHGTSCLHRADAGQVVTEASSSRVSSPVPSGGAPQPAIVFL